MNKYLIIVKKEIDVNTLINAKDKQEAIEIFKSETGLFEYDFTVLKITIEL